MSTPTGIDPRGPRFTATITSLLLLAATFLALTGISTATTYGWFAQQADPRGGFFVGEGSAVAAASPWERAQDPGLLLTAVIALLFLWGVVSPASAPWAVVFRRFVRPRLSAPAELEDPRPPRFAQGVGLVVVSIGLGLHLLGVPWALPAATSAAFIAAFLNAAFAFCLGCQIYLLLQRTGALGRPTSAA